MKKESSRRQFLRRGGAGMLYGMAVLRGLRASALPLGLPLGLQLYAVRELLKADYAGTLRQIAALGYTEVEAAGFFGHTAPEVNQAMRTAGLRLVSAHVSPDELQTHLEDTIAFAHAVGLQAVVCSFPAFKEPARVAGAGYQERVRALGLDDFRYTAERLNVWGKQVRAAGLRLAYHNYTMEFVPRDGVVPYDEMLRLTDPALVDFELDCGWALVGGADPAAYLRRYGNRFTMLHVKDFKPVTGTAPGGDPAPAELGRGTVDFVSLFGAARGTAVRHCFVEQEGFDMPPLESLRVDAEYMQHLRL